MKRKYKLIIVLILVLSLTIVYNLNKNYKRGSEADTIQEVKSLTTAEENCAKNKISYIIKSSSYNEKKVEISFPYVDGISDMKKQKKINEIIKDEAFVVFNDFYEGQADDLSLEINYTITWESENLLSIQYYGYSFDKGAAHTLDLLYTVNLDMNKGCKLMLKDIINIDKNFVNKYKNYEIADPDKNQIQVGAFKYILDTHSTDDLLRSFNGADTSFNNSDYVFSYFRDDALGISINVPYVAGNHLEIELKYQDIKDNINYENKIWKDLLH